MNLPRRPPVLVRAPERDEKNNPPDKAAAGEAVSPELYGFMNRDNPKPDLTELDITVYTNTGVCPHGPALLEVLRGFSFKHVDVSQCRPPAELTGTPSVVHKRGVYCGDAAFELAEYFVSQRGAKPAKAEAPRTNPFTKAPDDSMGCGLSQALAPPAVVEVDESKFSESTDEAMQRLLAGRK